MNNKRLKPYPITKLSTRREGPHRPSQGYLIPYAEAWESAQELLIEVSLPASVQGETIDVRVEQDVLCIHGLYESSQGKAPNRFYRSFMIPFSVNATRIKASFQPTLLMLHIPKSGPCAPYQIAVQVRAESMMRNAL